MVQRDEKMHDRNVENIIWAVNALLIVIYTAASVITSIPETGIPEILFAVMMLVALCGCVLSEDKNKKGILLVYGILALGLTVMCGKYWCGLLLVGVTSLYSCYGFIIDRYKSNTAVNLLLLGGFFYYGSLRTEEPVGIKDYIVLAMILVFGIIWSLAVYMMFRYYDMHKGMEKALRASALDAMNERELRIEIARSKNLAEENAKLEERERISRDIHNAVGHTLSAASVTLDAAQVLMDTDKDKANQKIDQANDRIHEAIGSVRSVVRTLDAEDDSVLVTDYVNSLKELVNNFSLDTDIKIHHNLDLIKDEGKLHLNRAAFISSSVSELLTNGVKHGNAKIFVILMELDAVHIGIQVSDNGNGWGDLSYDQKQERLRNGFGLKKMADYVKANAGSIEITGEDGFCVKIGLPR